MIEMLCAECLISVSSRGDVEISLTFVNFQGAIYSTCVFLPLRSTYSRHNTPGESILGVAY